MKIALISDSHFGVKQNSQVMNRNIARFFREIFFPTLRERGVDEIVHLGDLTDNRQSINFLSLDTLNREFIEPITVGGHQLHIIAGNHDAYYRSTNRVNSLDQLLPDVENIRTYTNFPMEEDFLGTGIKVLFLPWINNENEERTYKLLKESKAQYVFAHLELSGFDFMSGVTAEDGMDPWHFARFNHVYTGHYHTRQTQGNITYIGSPYQMSFADSGERRGFYILDLDSGEAEFIENPHQCFCKFEFEDEYGECSEEDVQKYQDSFIRIIVPEEADTDKLNQFIETLYKVGPADVSVIENFNRHDAEDIDVEAGEDTFTLLNRYIDEELDPPVERAKLKKELSSLYTEAQTERVS